MKAPDRIMEASDMFEPDTKQLFSVRTGNRIGIVREDDPGTLECPNKAQTELFLEF